MRHGSTDHQAVINDWDIAGDATHVGVADAEHANCAGRRGTLHFMAIELNWRFHDNLPHHYRHELEALLWVLAFVFLAYRPACETDVKPREVGTKSCAAGGNAELVQGFMRRPIQRQPSQIRRWLAAVEYKDCGSAKYTLLIDIRGRGDPRAAPHPHPAFEADWFFVRVLMSGLYREFHLREVTVSTLLEELFMTFWDARRPGEELCKLLRAEPDDVAGPYGRHWALVQKFVYLHAPGAAYLLRCKATESPL
ncbi:uncharacterized protein SCHCODRAFT_02630961 [Schizophyllum commune H4-8]|nr:uncharacterized protein SCHCODRAFT_02630961 [Schizophyllum commune H4-8]KAI5890136.1 hypothetical protein SCHCODRAFT_02630961 [Schizophyllum commune H4-8]